MAKQPCKSACDDSSAGRAAAVSKDNDAAAEGSVGQAPPKSIRADSSAGGSTAVVQAILMPWRCVKRISRCRRSSFHSSGTVDAFISLMSHLPLTRVKVSSELVCAFGRLNDI
jgi:hypothetical protein